MTDAEKAMAFDEPSTFSLLLNKLRGVKTDGIIPSLKNALPVAPEYLDTPTRPSNPDAFKPAPLQLDLDGEALKRMRLRQSKMT